MLEFLKINLNKIIVHRVGNKSLDEGYKLSDQPIDLQHQPDLAKVLTDYFLKSFVEVPLYNFTHVTNIELNEIYTVSRNIFGGPKG